MVMLISNHMSYGCFLTWWYITPNNTPKNDHFLVGKNPWFLGKPTILENPHIYTSEAPYNGTWKCQKGKEKQKTSEPNLKKTFRTSVLCFFHCFQGFFLFKSPEILCLVRNLNGQSILWKAPWWLVVSASWFHPISASGRDTGWSKAIEGVAGGSGSFNVEEIR